MNILILILQSIRPDTNHGGSSKILKDIATDLAGRSHSVRILCARNQGNTESFELVPGAEVSPSLPYRESWQDTYLVPPFDLARAIQLVLQEADWAEHILLFDTHFLFQDLLPKSVPLTCSLRDFVYVHAIQGGLLFRRDRIITPSAFIADAFADAVGNVLPTVRDRLNTIPNGIDLSRFRPLDPRSARNDFGIGANDDVVLLFPHRPEDAKGLGESLGVVNRLVALGRKPRLIIPRGTDFHIMPEVRTYYETVAERVDELGLAPHVSFIDWVLPEQMPLLYCCADVTLCVGTIVEAFGNTTLESLACGTPVIASSVGGYKELDGFSKLRRIPVGDVDAAVEALVELESEVGVEWTHRDRQEIADRFGYSNMLARFRQALEDGTPLPPLEARGGPAPRVRVPVWISDQGGRMYNEYTGSYADSTKLGALWAKQGRRAFAPSEAGLSAEQTTALIEWGGLVWTFDSH